MFDQNQYNSRREAFLAAFPRLLQNGLPGLEFNTGWDPIICELFKEIDALLDDRQAASFKAVQIKEKWGTLRFYYQVDG